MEGHGRRDLVSKKQAKEEEGKETSQVLTFPDVLIPFASDAYTITQARKRQKAKGHLISPGYSIPAEIFNTKYLRVK